MTAGVKKSATGAAAAGGHERKPARTPIIPPRGGGVGCHDGGNGSGSGNRDDEGEATVRRSLASLQRSAAAGAMAPPMAVCIDGSAAITCAEGLLAAVTALAATAFGRDECDQPPVRGRMAPTLYRFYSGCDRLQQLAASAKVDDPRAQ